jgi:hypothetical protein
MPRSQQYQRREIILNARPPIRVARFFLVENTKNGEKYTKLLRTIPNVHKI